MRGRKSLIFTNVIMSVLLLPYPAAQKFYLRILQGDQFRKAYYGMGGNEVLCENGARSYWMPLNYRKYEWDLIPAQD